MAQGQGGAEHKRIPLVVMPENRDFTTSKDARLVNCYMESGSQKGELHIYKRPGVTRELELSEGVYSTLQPPGGAATALGAYNWLGDIYSVYSSGGVGTLYKNASSVGTVSATGGQYSFSQSLASSGSFIGTTTGPQIVLQCTNALYSYDGTTLITAATSGAVVTDGSLVIGAWYQVATVGTSTFPGNNTVGTIFKATTNSYGGNGTVALSNCPTTMVPGLAYLDQTTYVLDPSAGIWGSYYNCPQFIVGGQGGSLGSNFLTAQIEPDPGVAIAKQLVYVIVFKQWSTEVFYDAGNASGSPLGAVQGAKVNYGCIAASSIQDIDGTLLWLGSNRNSNTQVLMLENVSAQVVSTNAIDKLIDNFDADDTIYSLSFKEGGHKFYLITDVQANLTLVYDITEKIWCQWTDVNGNYLPFVSTTYDNEGDRVWQHATDGYFYAVSSANWNDQGSIITSDIYTPNYDGGVNSRKVMGIMYFTADRVVGSTLQVRHSDDDYVTWSRFRNVNLGSKRPYLDKCGTFYRRAFHLRHACNTPFRISAIEPVMDVGT